MSLAGAEDLPLARQLLVAEKLKQWQWFERFIELNPDVKERWKQHKTYEILNNEHGNR